MVVHCRPRSSSALGRGGHFDSRPVDAWGEAWLERCCCTASRSGRTSRRRERGCSRAGVRRAGRRAPPRRVTPLDRAPQLPHMRPSVGFISRPPSRPSRISEHFWLRSVSVSDAPRLQHVPSSEAPLRNESHCPASPVSHRRIAPHVGAQCIWVWCSQAFGRSQGDPAKAGGARSCSRRPRRSRAMSAQRRRKRRPDVRAT